MNSIRISDIRIENNHRVIWSYEVEGEWTSCFTDLRESYADYNVDLSSVPLSILAVPFICNILPAVWLCDAVVSVCNIDKAFIEHVEMIKTGYINMYPMLSFKGSIEPKCVEDNSLPAGGHSGCLFSGGIDAYTTFFRHYEERPSLVTIWGADIKLSDNTGWNNLLRQVQDTADRFGVGYHTVKSDFRRVLNENNLDRIVALSNDKWWHGFQNSLAMISLTSPLAYVEKWQTVYIASSFSKDAEGLFTGGSVPSIDNNVYFGGCKADHDGYELNRQQKTAYIVEEHKKRNQDMYLRVCWESEGGHNCSHCEKCYRTILGLVAEGEDPNSYGFVWNSESVNRCRKDLMRRVNIYEYDYYPIQNRMRENQNNIPGIDDYRWFIDVDISKINYTVIKRIRKSRLNSLIVRGMNRLKRVHL